MSKFLRAVLILPVLACGAAFANNPNVDAGEAGYITWTPWAMFWGKGGFQEVLIGPTKYGFSLYHYTVQQISIQEATYDEEFSVVDANQIKIHFEVHFLMRPDVTRIKDVVEKYAGANWYAAIVREPLRTFVRDALGAQDSQTLSVSQDRIQQAVQSTAQKWITEKNLPFILDQVSVGNFQFPDVISDAAAEKQANLQKLAAKSTLLDIAKKDAEIKAAEAQGIRQSQDIINQTLTPIYVQHEMVEAIEKMAGKAGNAVIYVPIGANGLPLVSSMNVQPVQQQGRQ